MVRIAALLHDVGHLPFSHAAESVLLPEGWDHERITADIIGFVMSTESTKLRKPGRPPLDEEIILSWADAHFQKYGF